MKNFNLFISLAYSKNGASSSPILAFIEIRSGAIHFISKHLNNFLAADLPHFLRKGF